MLTSISDSAATITTAASAVCGRSASSECRNSRSTTTSAAPTTPVSWVLAFDCSATAVREPLVDTAKPWKSPAAMFAAPMPIISWLGSTSSPRRAAKLVAVAIVSVNDTSVMPTAAINRGTTSPAFVHGSVGVGIPCGSAPTVVTPLPASPNTADATVAPTTPTSTAGSRVVMRGSTSSRTSTAAPTIEGRRMRLVEAVSKRAQLREERIGVRGEAEQLRQLPDDDRDREAVHVADLHLLREQVGDEPELPQPKADLGEPHQDGQHAGQGDCARGIFRLPAAA